MTSNVATNSTHLAPSLLLFRQPVAVPRWGGGGTGPQIVARPPNLAVLLTHHGQSILRKISKFDANGCQILTRECAKFDFRWGSAPDLAGELVQTS